MAKKNSRNTKGRIIQAAWQLFYQQGYDDTTVEEIIEASGTSRGSFYHYFEGKDALLSSVLGQQGADGGSDAHLVPADDSDDGLHRRLPFHSKF